MKLSIKRIMVMVLSVVLVLSTIYIGNFAPRVDAANSGTNAETVTYAKKEVVFESDYDDASATTDTATFKKLSNQLYPKTETVDGEENRYLYYAQSDAIIGILRLGHTYKSASLTDYTPIKVTPGQTYYIEFDYRLKPYLDTTTYPEWPLSDLTIGVAVGSASADLSSATHTTYITNSYTSYYEVIEVLASAKTQPTVDWTHKTITVTIPKTCDVSNFDSLQLYATFGQRCGLHIDNVKVTTANKVTGTVIAENDYDDALAVENVYGGFARLSNQMYPKKDGDNGYIYYAQSNRTIGILRLGHSYTNKSLTEYTPITVTPGQTYSIEFDYRLKPYLDTTTYPEWPTADLTIGVAVGPANESLADIEYKKNDKTGYVDKYVSWYQDIEVLASKNTQPNVDWTHKTITVTIPEDCDVSTYDSLQLYATFGQRCGLHIDNVKVTALAPANITYEIDGATKTEYSPSGIPDNYQPSEDYTVEWYMDEEYTAKVDFDNYERSTTVTTVKLYGIKEARVLEMGDFTSESSAYYGLDSFTVGKAQKSNQYNHCAWSIKSEAVADNDGTDGMLVYKYSYDTTNNATVGNASGNVPNASYPVTILDRERDNTKYKLLPNTTYTVSFDYYVAAKDESSQDDNAQIVLARMQPEADFTDIYNGKGPVSYKALLNKNATVTSMKKGVVLIDASQESSTWQNTSYTFTTFAWDDTIKLSGDYLSSEWNRLSLCGFGYGEIYIDNISIVQHTDNAISTVNEYFEDNMMFQQNKPMTVWGTAISSESLISANLYRNGVLVDNKEATISDDLVWELEFESQKGSYDTYSIVVYDTGVIISSFSNVLVGELWLAAGQSNMQHSVVGDVDSTRYEANENIRIYKCRTVPEDSALPATEQSHLSGYWILPSSVDAIQYTSAVAYSTCQQLQKQLDIPVGFLDVAKGSTTIQTWLSRDVIENSEVIKDGLTTNGKYYSIEQLESITANWHLMTIMYNNIIAPLTKTHIAGVLWYQGESNIRDVGRSSLYKAELYALATSYREAFGFNEGEEMPFVFAHLAPYVYANQGDSTISEFSETLSETVKELENSGLVNAMQIPIYDIPVDYLKDNAPIHPCYKFEVGTRFSDVLMKQHYTVNTESYLAPVYDSMEVSGNRIILTFKNVGDGLEILNNGTTLRGFKISADDGVFVNANAKIISKNQVAVWSLGVMNPTAVTYAWDNMCTSASLGNSINIPAVAFRTNANEDNVYQLSNEWLDFEKSTKWIYTDENGSAGEYSPIWNSSEGTLLSFVSGSFDAPAMKIEHTQNSTFEPIFYDVNCKFTLNGTTAISMVIRNNDNTDKTCKVSVVSGGKTYTLKAINAEDDVHMIEKSYGIYRFSTRELYENGTLVTENVDQILSDVARLYFNVSGDAGSIIVDDITISTCDVSNVFMLGDANGSDDVDIRDLVRLKKHIVQTETAKNDLIVDTNNDSIVDKYDLKSLRQFLLNW